MLILSETIAWYSFFGMEACEANFLSVKQTTYFWLNHLINVHPADRCFISVCYLQSPQITNQLCCTDLLSFSTTKLQGQEANMKYWYTVL